MAEPRGYLAVDYWARFSPNLHTERVPKATIMTLVEAYIEAVIGIRVSNLAKHVIYDF